MSHEPPPFAGNLRDYDSSEHVPAIWRRLKAELRARPSDARRSPLLWMWAPAFSALLFGSGVFVGARFIRPQALPGLQAEPKALAARPAAAVPTKNAAEPEPLLPPAKAWPARARHVTNPGASAAQLRIGRAIVLRDGSARAGL